MHEDIRNNSVLTDPVFRVQTVDGEISRMTLPALLSALATDKVLDFPGVRQHHAHLVHMFLAQLMAMVIEVRRPDGEQGFLEALLQLDERCEAWQIIPLRGECGFMQPAFAPGIPDDEKSLSNEVQLSLSDIDFIWFSNRHSLKREMPGQVEVDSWLWQLIATQTGAGVNGAGHYGSFRMNSGTSSRCYWAVYDNSWGVGRRVLEDALLINEKLETNIRDFGFAKNGGMRFLHIAEWPTGKGPEAMLYPDEIDARAIEVTRRINLCVDEAGVLFARKVGSDQPRCVMAKTKGNSFWLGVCGDIWAPIISDKECSKSLTLDSRGLIYSQVAKFACQIASKEETVLAAPATLRRVDDPLLVISGIAAGQGKTEGIFHREIPFGKGEDDNPFAIASAGETAEAMILDASLLMRAVRAAGSAYLDKKLPGDIDGKITARATAMVDDIFFDHLGDIHMEVEGADVAWASALHDIGLEVLESMFRQVPVSRMKRMRRISSAEASFRLNFWSTKNDPGFSHLKQEVYAMKGWAAK